MDTDTLAPPDLLPITIDDKARFDRALGLLDDPVSDATFANIFMWSGALRLSWREILGRLCVFANSTGDLTMLLPPIDEPGADPVELGACLGACFEIMDAYNDRVSDRSRSRIEYVSDEMLERISAVRGVSLSATPLWSDYVYRCDRMIDLAGGDLKSKRHARSKFVNTYPDHQTRALGDEDTPACVELLGRWSTHGDRSHEGELTDSAAESAVLRERDRLATERALGFRRELGLTGMTLWVGDRLAGFTLGEPLGREQATVLIEKTDPEFHGAPQYIFSEFCRTCWSDRALINAGDDWGIPGLRYTKQSYRPVRLMSKHVLTMAPERVRHERAMVSMPTVAPAHRITPLPEPAPTPTFTIRAGVASDADAILNLERDAFGAEAQAFTPRQVRALLANPRAVVLVATEPDGSIVGWAVGLLRTHTHPRSGTRRRSGRVYSVAVASGARGRGIGRALTQNLLGSFREQGVRRAFLEVRVTNATAIALYESLGFTRRGPAVPDYYAPGVDAIRMGMRLGEEAERGETGP